MTKIDREAQVDLHHKGIFEINKGVEAKALITRLYKIRVKIKVTQINN